MVIVKRRMTMRIRAIAILSVLTFVSTVWAQSLGEIAEQEKKRRKGTTHVITERDLARARGSNYSQPPETLPDGESSEASETSEGASSGESTGENEEEKTPAEIRAEQRADWQKREQNAREKVDRLQKQVNDLQARANASVDQLGAGRAELLDTLEKKEQELASAQEELTNLEEERRRAGIER
jgi:hypothetical protein